MDGQDIIYQGCYINAQYDKLLYHIIIIVEVHKSISDIINTHITH
jgi:hypothetical protein